MPAPPLTLPYVWMQYLHLLAYCQPNHCQLANTIPAQIATAYLRVTDNESVERYSERHTDAQAPAYWRELLPQHLTAHSKSTH